MKAETSAIRRAEIERRISPLKNAAKGITERFAKKKAKKGGLRPNLSGGGSSAGNIFTQGSGTSSTYHTPSNSNPFTFNSKPEKEKRKSITIRL
jgi:hypothetical protein